MVNDAIHKRLFDNRIIVMCQSNKTDIRRDNMSLSERPQPKITAGTAKDICADIWAGAIEYATKTGYKLNPLVTTAIWNGLLLSVKKDLEEYGLLVAVQQQFMCSFSYIYDIGLDEVELLADIKAKQQKLWEIITTELDSLNGELEVLAFISLLDAVNAQFFTKDDTVQTIKPAEECVRLFLVQRQLLSSHIYGLVHDFDNRMTRQFAPAPITTKTPVPSDGNACTRKSAEREPSAKQGKAKSKSVMGFVVLALVLLVELLLLAQANSVWFIGFFKDLSGILVEVGAIILFVSAFFTKKNTIGESLRLSGLYLFLIGAVLFCVIKIHLL